MRGAGNILSVQHGISASTTLLNAETQHLNWRKYGRHLSAGDDQPVRISGGP